MTKPERAITVLLDCTHSDALTLEQVVEVMRGGDPQHTCPTCGTAQHVHTLQVPTAWRPRAMEIMRFIGSVRWGRG